MSGVLQKVQTRGYWEIVIRPAAYKENRVPQIERLLPVMEQAAVEWTGWDFPHVDRQSAPEIGLNWIQSDVDWEHYVEVWRLYQSGQFLYYGGLNDDWLDQSSLEERRYPPNTQLSVTNTVFMYAKVFELASRLSTTELGDKSMTVGVRLHGLQGRTLRMDNPNRSGFMHPRAASLAYFPKAGTFSQEQLLTESRTLAVQWVAELFARFNWTPGIEFLQVMQGELFRHT